MNNEISNNDEPVLAESDTDDGQSQHHLMSGHIQKSTSLTAGQEQWLVIAGGKRWEEGGKKRIYFSRRVIVSIIEEMEPVRYGCPRRKLPPIPESIWVDCRTGHWGSKSIIGSADVIAALRQYIGEPV